MKRLLCIWLPNWPIQRLRSELRQAAERDSVHTDSVPIAEFPIAEVPIAEVPIVVE